MDYPPGLNHGNGTSRYKGRFSWENHLIISMGHFHLLCLITRGYKSDWTSRKRWGSRIKFTLDSEDRKLFDGNQSSNSPTLAVNFESGTLSGPHFYGVLYWEFWSIPKTLNQNSSYSSVQALLIVSWQIRSHRPWTNCDSRQTKRTMENGTAISR